MSPIWNRRRCKRGCRELAPLVMAAFNGGRSTKQEAAVLAIRARLDRFHVAMMKRSFARMENVIRRTMRTGATLHAFAAEIEAARRG